MIIFSKISTLRVFFVLLISMVLPASAFVVPAQAGGVVGNGKPASCTEAAFEAALVGGGLITFNCGPTGEMIGLNSEKLIQYPTTIDGGGKIVLEGGNVTRLFNVYLAPKVSVVLKNITLANGKADNGGAIYIGHDQAVRLENVTIRESHATMDGGAIYVNNNSTLTLKNVVLLSNTSSEEGGAVYNNQGTLNFTNVLFELNTAYGWGGGLNNNQGAAILTGVTFRRNRAGDWNAPGGNILGPGGGGIDNYKSTLTVTNSLFESNIGGNAGGGLRVMGGGTVSLTNVTLSDNEAYYGGGSIFNYDGDVTLLNVTLYGNADPGTSNDGVWSQGPMKLKNTILAGGTGHNCELTTSNITSQGNNLSNDYYCINYLNKSGDQNNIDPLLGPLQNNGGPTWTHLPKPNSPTFEAGTNSGCPANDQRGVHRPQDSVCDIGAVEVAFTSTFKSIGDYDGWILESTETSGVGGTLNSTNTTFNVGDSASNKQYRGILHFNTAILPDNAVIIKATLKIMKSADGSGDTSTLGGLLVDMTKPYFGAAALAIGDFQAAAGKPAIFNAFTIAGSWYSATMKNSGFTYVNRSGVTQFRLRFTKGDNNGNIADVMTFYSGDAANTAYRPKLIIQYYLP